MKSLTILQPDDWHVHLRDGDFLTQTVPATAAHFSRALVMPNLKPPLTTVSAIEAYRNSILAHLPSNTAFTPYMTFYLNESVKVAELEKAKTNPYILGAKLYPAGATTNSEAGAQSISALYPLLEIMQDQQLVLQIHGEIPHGDIFDREQAFLTEYLEPILKNFPKLKVVLEHISTKAAVDFVLNGPETLAATITPHHLLYNRNNLLAGAIRPHYYCLPVLKRAEDQRAIQQAAVSGNAKFFAGTDSAPHALGNKISPCGCAGIYSAPFAISLYAQIFDTLGKLNKLNNFLSVYGASFYQLDESKQLIELARSPQKIPNTLPFGQDVVVPIAYGETLDWSITDDHT